MTIPDQNAPFVVIPALTRNKFWIALGTIICSLFTIIFLLLKIAYGDMKDDIKDVKADIKDVKASVDKLSESFRGAYKAAVDVNDSDLIKTIGNLNKIVVELKTGQTVITNKINNMKPEQYDWQDIKMQLNNIQRQIHTIPGAKP